MGTLKNWLGIIVIIVFVFSCDPDWQEPFTIRGGIFIDAGVNIDGSVGIGVLDENIIASMSSNYKWTTNFSNSYQTISADDGYYEFDGVTPGDYMILAFVDSNGNGFWDFDLNTGTAEAYGVFPDYMGLKYFDFPVSNASIFISGTNLAGNAYFDSPEYDAITHNYTPNDINAAYYNADKSNLYLTLQFYNDLKIPSTSHSDDEIAGYIHFDTDYSYANNFYDSVDTYYNAYYKYYIDISTYNSALKSIEIYDYNNNYIGTVNCEMTQNMINLAVPLSTLGDPADSIDMGVIVSNYYDFTYYTRYEDAIGIFNLSLTGAVIN